MSPVRPFDHYDDATAELTLELPAAGPLTTGEDTPSFKPFVPKRIERPAPAQKFETKMEAAPVGLQSPGKEIGRGSMVCQRYVLEDPIGIGGTSIVYRARDLRREEHGVGESRLALKTPRIELPTYAHAVERLKREFRLAQALTHPHVVRVFDLDEEYGRWYMTMELLEGKTLAAALAQSPFSSGHPAFPPRRAADILRACGEALAFAHDHGVVHGDFKPGNIFLPVHGPLRVLDFGSATSTEPSIEPHAPAATACYASPEVLSGRRPDRRDDIFAFACVAHELLGGVHPFERRSALEASRAGWKPLRSWNLTDRQWYALEGALSFNRDARPSNIRTLLAELFPASPLDRVEVQECIDAPEPTQAPAAIAPMVIPPLDLPTDAFKTSAARPAFTTAIAAVVLVAAAVAAYFQLNKHPEWPQEIRAGATTLYSDVKERIEGAIGTADAVPAAAPALTEPSPPVAPASVSVTPAPKQTLSTAEAFGVALSPATPGATVSPSPSTPSRSTRARDTRDTAAVVAPLDIFVSFADEKVTVNEGANSAVLRLKRDGNLDARTDVRWRTVPGSARPGEDYVPDAGGVAIFANGQASRTIYIPLLRDAIAEPEEEFFVELYDPASGTQIWPTARAKIVIRDNN